MAPSEIQNSDLGPGTEPTSTTQEDIQKSFKDGATTEATTKVPLSVQMNNILYEINEVGIQLQKKKGFTLDMLTHPTIKHDCTSTIPRGDSFGHIGLPQNDKTPKRLEPVTSFR